MTKSFETFRDIGSWEMGNLTQQEPSAFNGIIRFRKQRVTIEDIDEPNEILCKRLQKLWDECDNHHLWQPLKTAANSIGYEFKGERGSKRKSK